MKKLAAVWIFYFVIIVFFYRNSLHSYFEGDEWYYFSIFLPLTHHPFGLVETFIKSFTESNTISGGGHVAPLYNVIWFLQNKFFGLNFDYYIYFSLVVHTLNTFFLYIFVRNITKNKLLAGFAGFIFAVSCVQYEAITWVMAVVPTQISLLFTFLGLIAFVQWGRKGTTIQLSVLVPLGLFLAGIFTKETVIGVVILAPILLLPSGKRNFLRGIIFSFFTMIVYLPIRFGIPLLVDKTPIHSLHLPIQNLILYQILLIERMITEVFVSSNILLVISRYISENVYLKMSSSLIPKTSLELFSQSIGADILLFALSPIFFGVCFVVFQKALQRRKNYEVLFFSVALIVTSAFPLLFILNYAPWWIDGAFIDSRHLYLPSVGASILLAFGFFYTYKFFSKRRFSMITIFLFSLILIGWVWIQYAVIQKQADKFANLSVMRQSLLKSIDSYLPQLPQKAIFFVESDTGYFGFGQIPPFQTNLGQVLALTYYEKNQLPAEFFTKVKYMEKGILGEGVVTRNNKSFGYYLQRSSLLRDLTLGKFAIDDIHAYSWIGATNELKDKTNEVRGTAKKYIEEIVSTENWTTIKIHNLIKFSYPVEGQLQVIDNDMSDVLNEYELQLNNDYPITIKLETKSNKLPFHEFLRLEKKSNEIPQASEYHIKNVYRTDGTPLTSVYISTGEYVRYFVPFSNGTEYFEVSTIVNQDETDIDNKYTNKNIELLLSTLYF